MKKRFLFRSLFFSMLIGCTVQAQVNNFTTYQAASLVVGQADFTAQSTAYTQSTTPGANASAVSVKGLLAVAAQSNGRIMLWNSIPTTHGQPADLILGKPDFTSTASGCTQSLTGSCYGVAFSPDGNKLIVSDSYNNRILIWNSIPTSNGAPADVVIGQTDFTSQSSGCSASQLYFPAGVITTPDGKLIVNDLHNNRVLIFNSIPTTNGASADVVIGQTNFTTRTSGKTANKINSSWYSALSPDGKLLICEASNHRVIIFNRVPTENGASADVVIGQTDFGMSTSGLSASKFYIPIGVAVSPDGKVAVGEAGNHRVLIFNQVPTTNGASSDVVLGQPDFTTNTAGVSDKQMQYIYDVNFDLNGRLLVNGRNMNRVTIFGELPCETAELELSLNGDVDDVCGGSVLQYALKIHNNGDNAATNVIALTILPSGFTPASTPVASAGTYNSTCGYWEVPEIPADGYATLSFMGDIAPSVTTTIYANISASDQLDNDMSNNASSITLSSSAGTAPVITDDPNDVTVCLGSSASFTCGATGTGILTYQWQVNTGTGIFENIADDGNHSGAQTNELTIAEVELSQIGNLYRCVITIDGACSSHTLNAQLIKYNDITAPVVPVIADATGACSVTVTAPTAEDNCAGIITGTTADPLTYDTQGSYTITWSFDDGNGNTSTALQNVVVDDVTAPTFEVPSDIDVFITAGQVSYIVQGDEFDPKNVLDNCGVTEMSNNLFDGTSLERKALAVGKHTITWKVTDAGSNETSHSFIVNVVVGTGNEDICMDKIAIYPNPVAGNELHVDLGFLSGSVIEIIGLSGNIIKAQDQTGAIHTVDVGDLSTGFYSVRVINNTNVYTIKFIKK